MISREEVEKAVEIVRNGRSNTTWHREKSEEYNKALDTLISYAQQQSEQETMGEGEIIDIFRSYNFKGITARTVAGILANKLPRSDRKSQCGIRAQCGICGGSMVFIRGRYPHTDKREVCPTCCQERLEQIRDISDNGYGKSYTTKQALAEGKEE